MKRYETIVIIDPDLSKEAEAPIFERINDLIPQFEGFLVETDDWGTKKLAYEIKKKPRGHYVRIDFCGNGDLVQEMERSFRINDKVLKFMTVQLDNDADVEVIKAELAEKEAAKAQSAAEETKAEAPTEEAAAPEAADAPAETSEEPTEKKEEE